MLPLVETYLHLCRISDTVTALCTLVGLFVFDNLGRLPSGLQEFLGARLSVKNYMLVVVFSTCWYLSCRWAGAVRLEPHQAPPERGAPDLSRRLNRDAYRAIFPLTSVSGSFRMHVLLPFFALGTVLILLGRMLLRSAISGEHPGAEQYRDRRLRSAGAGAVRADYLGEPGPSARHGVRGHGVARWHRAARVVSARSTGWSRC